MTQHLLTQAQNCEDFLSALQAAFPEIEFEATSLPLDDTLIVLPSRHLIPAAHILVKEFGFYHLSAISGDDDGTGVHLLYHFWNHYGITLCTTLPYDALSIPTLTDLLPGAAFYEREAYEMFGVMFDGHLSLEPLLSPDDWEGEYMLRKSQNTQSTSEA